MSRRQPGFWSTFLGLPAPREKFSLEELQHLHEILLSTTVVTDQNRSVVVEALRAIAELIIWGDQHDPRFFEYFLENNMMGQFSKLLEKPSNRKGEIAEQVRSGSSCTQANMCTGVASASQCRAQTRLTPDPFVLMQVLQTLYILIQNVRRQTAIYYILSNNHVNDIVTLSFDFEDDEVLGYYINLLKTISLRLTPKSVQFFYQVALSTEDFWPNTPAL